ncbi:hypothetical protein JMJ58_03695 [Haloterrigena salifodinae]|uniref:Uncharacterized protein n=1 Tax=Haloterrigena salifodinae TaxID=2675099 RepID=A0A8T8E3D8_9EURY|nr:hypothetical protein [Haloterrigena salifodinae]QRV16012.1 hypothetical protein JMJ58_03695 [Haloterrigena salifodinae]
MEQNNTSQENNEQNEENKVSVSVTIDEDLADKTEGPEVNRSGVINKALRLYFDAVSDAKQAWEMYRHHFGMGDTAFEETEFYQQFADSNEGDEL